MRSGKGSDGDEAVFKVSAPAFARLGFTLVRQFSLCPSPVTRKRLECSLFFFSFFSICVPIFLPFLWLSFAPFMRARGRRNGLNECASDRLTSSEERREQMHFPTCSYFTSKEAVLLLAREASRMNRYHHHCRCSAEMCGK